MAVGRQGVMNRVRSCGRAGGRRQKAAGTACCLGAEQSRAEHEHEHEHENKHGSPPIPRGGAVPAGWHRGWAAAWPSGGLLHEGWGERCQQAQVLPLLPRRLSISSELTSNYMVNSINVKSSSLGSLGLNASLRRRHLIALRAGSCAALSPCRSRLSRGCFCSPAPTRRC